MAFVLFGSFNGYSGWENKIIEVCTTFFEKYQRFPNYIRMKETTMEFLFEELDLETENPEEHAVKDSNGNLLLPVQIKDDDSWDDVKIDDYESQSENDVIYPVMFGLNDDSTVSFVTNKFELKFLEGEDLPEDYFIVQFGDDPDGGGEDYEEETYQVNLQLKLLAA